MDNASAISLKLAQFWGQLRKPLELEMERGCPNNTIVSAGIGQYARLWAERYPDVPGWLDTVNGLAESLRGYDGADTNARTQMAMAAIAHLRELEMGAPVGPQPPIVKPKPAPQTRARKAVKPAEAEAAKLPSGVALLDMPIETLAPRAQWPRLLSSKLNLITVRDLLYHIPRDWVEIKTVSELEDGKRVATVGTVKWREYERVKSRTSPHPLYKYTLGVADETGEAWVISMSLEPARPKGGAATWSPAKLLFNPGDTVFVVGNCDRTGQLVQITLEEIFAVSPLELNELQVGAQVPIYPLCAGVFQSQVHRAVLRVMNALGASESTNATIDPIPQQIRAQYDLLPLLDALREMHFRRNPAMHEEARRRLAFEEFLVPQLYMAQRRFHHHHDELSRTLTAATTIPDIVAQVAKFTPTPAQSRVLREIEDDLRSTRPMNRLLQGDVGSGKTLVAAGALAYTVRSGAQAAMMAPTELLAGQLHLVLTHLLAPLGIKPVLVTGSLNSPERRAAEALLASGAGQIAVGTHALISESVAFQDLGLIIIDEQHRFGVNQRATLRGKGLLPNTLVMSATPIPRTLSLTVFGDLDISVLDDMPPGRTPITTHWASITSLPEVYDFIRAHINAGRQAYVLCPMVEASEMLEVDAAEEMYTELQERIFPDLKIGLLHGRLKPEVKDAAMEAFRAGQTQILACTTVVEVGVDVPNATVMLIHNAERFGLAQLHQLRGRVGRSTHASYCFLITHPRYNPAVKGGEPMPARERLRTMVETTDGFQIAEFDLQLRGPGDYLGTRQSGLFDFKIGNMLQDGISLTQARQAAQEIISADPTLITPSHAELRRRLLNLGTKVDHFRE